MRKPTVSRPVTGRSPRFVAYMRTSTDRQDLTSQQTGIVEVAKVHGLQPIEFIEEQISGKVAVADRKLGKEVVPSLALGDTLIVGEVSRLGRTLRDVLDVLHTLRERGVTVRVVKGDTKIDQSIPSKVYVTMLGLMAEIERDLISARTREGLANARRRGKRLGRPPGLPARSKLDQRSTEIKDMARRGVTIANIARMTDANWTTVKRWLGNNGVNVARDVRT